MMSTRIPKSITIEDVESLYRDFERNQGAVEIPNGFRSLKIGLISRLSQFFITIAKAHEPVFTFRWLNVGVDASVRKVIDDPICLTALMMNDQIIGDGGAPVKSRMNRAFIKRFDMPVAAIGRQLQMMAVDHSIPKYAYPDCFYVRRGGEYLLKGGTYYYELLSAFLRDRAKQSLVDAAERKDISTMLAELVSNTEEHAKSEFNKGITPKSIRSVVLSLHQITSPQDLLVVSGEDSAIHDYISAIKPIGRALDLLEISVFDSGPGLLDSFSSISAPTSLEEEADITFRCFDDGITSKPNGIGMGRGLHRARRLLNARGGFLSVRTGRLSVYRDFYTRPVLGGEAEHGFKFFDEQTKSSSVATAMSAVEGVSYTILVPIK